jgi:hypothetical protein
MTERGARMPYGPRPGHGRRRWIVAGGLAAGWLVLLDVTGSAIGATMALIALAAVAGLAFGGLRLLGITRQHPWVQQLAARPWRDGQDVLQAALRHLPEVFVVLPGGAVLAPSAVEVELNPDDLRTLCERMDIGLINDTAAEVYEEAVAARGARLSGAGPADVRVVPGLSVPAGTYRVRPGRPVAAGLPGRPADPDYGRGPGRDDEPAYVGADSAAPYVNQGFAIHDGRTRDGARPGPRAGGLVAAGSPTEGLTPAGLATVSEIARPRVPVLRLITGDLVTDTTTSGARAGRGVVELPLPAWPTVSREHGRFTYSGGQWWLANLGRNGLTVNGTPVAGECPVSDGDLIRWGSSADALASRVEIR